MPNPEAAKDSRLRTLVAMPEATWAQVVTPAVRDRLERVAELLGMQHAAPVLDGSFDAVRAELAEAEVLLTGWGCPPITAEVLDAARKLRAVVHAAGTIKTFVDPVVFDRGIVVSSAAAANAIPVAEFALAAIVLAGKRAFRHRDWYRTVDRSRPLPGAPVIGNLGTTIGVLGASRIGRLVLERLRGPAR